VEVVQFGLIQCISHTPIVAETQISAYTHLRELQWQNARRYRH